MTNLGTTITTATPAQHNNIRTAIRSLTSGDYNTSQQRGVHDLQILSSIDEIMTGVATPAQIGAFLVAFKVEYFILTPNLLFSTATKMLSFAEPCPLSGGAVFDVVGTGGDKFDTFNISTATAITVAALGTKVAKHGNRSQSGRIGSADFMEALGVNIMMEPRETVRIIEECGFGFLFAQKFHPAMKYSAPVRREIGPTHMLVGVSLPSLGPLYAQVLSFNPRIVKAMVVHSMSGMDEIGIDCPTLVWTVDRSHCGGGGGGGVITQSQISPEHFGLPTRPIESVVGGKTARDNAQIFRDMLEQKEHIAPYRDWLLMNCAAALVLLDKAKTYVEGVQVARERLNDGTVERFLNKYLKRTAAL